MPTKQPNNVTENQLVFTSNLVRDT